jgi:hypothetical protein
MLGAESIYEFECEWPISGAYPGGIGPRALPAFGMVGYL